MNDHDDEWRAALLPDRLAGWPAPAETLCPNGKHDIGPSGQCRTCPERISKDEL